MHAGCTGKVQVMKKELTVKPSIQFHILNCCINYALMGLMESY